jgi:hypothetical protein
MLIYTDVFGLEAAFYKVTDKLKKLDQICRLTTSNFSTRFYGLDMWRPLKRLQDTNRKKLPRHQ